MHPVSDKFKAAINGRHTMAARLVVRSHLETTGGTKLDFINATITEDMENDVRTRMRISLPLIDEYVPRDQSHFLHPFAFNDIHAYRGVDYEDGTEELVPLGVCKVSAFRMSDARDNPTIELSCFDYSRVYRRNRFLTMYNVQPGQLYTQEVIDMLDSVRLHPHKNVEHSVAITPALSFGGSGDTGGGNAWDAGSKMMTEIGYEIFFSHQNVLTIRPKQRITQASPVWTYAEGVDSQMLYVTRDIVDEDFFNYVQVRGENTSNTAPVTGYAADEDPTSPTSIHSDLGIIPTFFTSKYVTSEEQAETLARAILNEKLDELETVRLIIAPNPALRTGDMIRVIRERSGVNQDFFIKAIPAGLSYEQPIHLTLTRKR